MTGWMELMGVGKYNYRLTKSSDACGGPANSIFCGGLCQLFAHDSFHW